MERFSDERRKKIGEAKVELKGLASKQRLDKRLLGTDHRTLDYVPMGEVQLRRMRITALHNVYALLRGKDHKHGIRENYLWYYERYFVEYKEKYLSCMEQPAAVV